MIHIFHNFHKIFVFIVENSSQAINFSIHIFTLHFREYAWITN